MGWWCPSLEMDWCVWGSGRSRPVLVFGLEWGGCRNQKMTDSERCSQTTHRHHSVLQNNEKSHLKYNNSYNNLILSSCKEHRPLCQADTLPRFGVPGGSLFTFTLRVLLASAGCSWVGDWSLSWGEGEGSCGDGDCNWGRDCEMGDWSWGAGDWSWAGGWGTGDWSWGPPPGVDESSLPCLAPVGPLRHGSSWVRGSMSTGPPDI